MGFPQKDYDNNRIQQQSFVVTITYAADRELACQHFVGEAVLEAVQSCTSFENPNVVTEAVSHIGNMN